MLRVRHADQLPIATVRVSRRAAGRRGGGNGVGATAVRGHHCRQRPDRRGPPTEQHDEPSAWPRTRFVQLNAERAAFWRAAPTRSFTRTCIGG